MGKHTKWTLPMLKEIQQRMLAGDSQKCIAAELGVSRWPLHVAMRRFGIKSKFRLNRETIEEHGQRAYSLRHAGKSWDKIAKSVGWIGGGAGMYAAVKTWALARGLPPPRSSK